MAEGGGFLARDAPLREQAKHLGEGAVHAAGGGEVAAGGMEFGKVERRSDDVTSGCRVAEQLFFSFGVKAAEGGMNVGAGHAALATVGEGELATVWQGFRRDPSLRFVARDDHPGWMVELAALWQCVGVYLDFFMRQKRRGLCYARKLLIAMTFARRNALLALDNLIIARELVIVGLVRREIGGIWLLGILDGARRRKDFVTVGRLLCGSHMQCYRRS